MHACPPCMHASPRKVAIRRKLAAMYTVEKSTLPDAAKMKSNGVICGWWMVDGSWWMVDGSWWMVVGEQAQTVVVESRRQ